MAPGGGDRSNGRRDDRVPFSACLPAKILISRVLRPSPISPPSRLPDGLLPLPSSSPARLTQFEEQSTDNKERPTPQLPPNHHLLLPRALPLFFLPLACLADRTLSTRHPSPPSTLFKQATSDRPTSLSQPPSQPPASSSVHSIR
jgi:hypothetical protein